MPIIRMDIFNITNDEEKEKMNPVVEHYVSKIQNNFRMEKARGEGFGLTTWLYFFKKWAEGKAKELYIQHKYIHIKGFESFAPVNKFNMPIPRMDIFNITNDEEKRDV